MKYNTANSQESKIGQNLRSSKAKGFPGASGMVKAKDLHQQLY